MNSLIELNQLICALNISVETAKFSEEPLDEYMVVTPLSDTFAFHGDDIPLWNIEEVRISIFSKNNYLSIKNRLAAALIKAGFIITDRHYIGHEDDTGYHHYAIDVAKDYEMEDV